MAHKQIIRVGDTVRFRFGEAIANGVVREDRGPLGVGGRHLYLIQFSTEPYYSSSIELPADEIEVVPEKVSFE